MRPGLTEVRDKQFGAFTAWQALCEYTRAEMRTRVDRGDWVRVFHGVYRESATTPNPQLRVEAARLSIGAQSLAAAYETAAELHGFAVSGSRATHVLGVQRSRTSRLVVHSDRTEPGDLELINGIVATNAIRTAVDVARTTDRLDAVATLDSALRLGFSRTALLAESERHRGRRGYVQAVELIELADGRAESPMESRARLRCIDAGLPRPEPQVEVSTRNGLRRLDLGWPEWRIGLEYDSATWHSGEAAAVRDDRRHNWLSADGWTVYYATATDVYQRPENFIEPLRCAMRGR
ncbi:hypothetical protein [Nocardia amikacinitolerans]|uniref:hypothetical protein n=1 Tax=Nocardia amikacinitolerans TaxID=756689 RepID=UPI0020A5E131|nr:hypothetical protein [Nocardia amikacinitolerans]MCP2277102.1 Transcriptional regulator, AbiEi antitoxin, Type IV TA system [Nocardia amikacinitolerans]